MFCSSSAEDNIATDLFVRVAIDCVSHRYYSYVFSFCMSRSLIKNIMLCKFETILKVTNNSMSKMLI